MPHTPRCLLVSACCAWACPALHEPCTGLVPSSLSLVQTGPRAPLAPAAASAYAPSRDRAAPGLRAAGTTLEPGRFCVIISNIDPFTGPGIVRCPHALPA